MSTRPRLVRDLTVGEVMTPQPATIGRDQSLATAHRMMREQGIRHLPVLEAGQLVGELSQRDLYFLETIGGIDLEADHVDDGMINETYAVAPEASVYEVAEAMAERKLGSAIVVERGRVVGIFTATDALRLLASSRRSVGSSRRLRRSARLA